MGLRTPWGMVYSALQQHGSFRPAVPSSVSPSHPQVVLSFKSLKELSRGAFPTCSPPTGLPALEGRAGRARTTTPGLKGRWQGGKEGEAGLQDNWHSTPLSHTTVQRESLIHSILIYSITPHSSQGCPNSSRSQNPCWATLQSSFHLHTRAVCWRQLRKEATPQSLCSPSLPLRLFTSPHSSVTTLT